MFITIHSQNEDLGWVIGKNPNNPLPLAKTIRKGYGVGYFLDPQTYQASFWDAPDEISYPYNLNDEFAYLHSAELISPLAGLNLISAFFNKIYAEYDYVAVQRATILALEVSPRTIRLLSTIPNFEIEVQDWSWPGYKTITITAKVTLQNLFNFLNVFLLQATFDNHLWLDKSDELAKKYIQALIDINAPYHMRYVFKVNLLSKHEIFDNYLTLLNGDRFNFTYGNTQSARYEWVKEHVSDPALIDLGCGEGFYFKLESRFSAGYFAVDTNAEILADAQFKLKRKNPKSEIQFFTHIDEVPYEIGKCDILLSEVIEHIPLDELSGFLQGLSRFNYNKIIITTPNAAFNMHYGIPDDEMRRDDHQWEMGYDELKDYLTRLGYNFEIYRVGDQCDGEAVTTGVVIYG